VTTEPLPPTGPAPPADRHGPAAATLLVGALLVLVGIGELTVQLPQGISVAVVASSGLGQVQALGEEEGGFASKVDTTAEAGGDRRLELDLRVGPGQVRVEQ